MSTVKPSRDVGSLLKGLLYVALDFGVGASLMALALMAVVVLSLFGCWVNIHFFGLDSAGLPGWLIHVINAGALAGAAMVALVSVVIMYAVAVNWRAPILWLQAVSRRRLESLDREKKAEAARQRLAERGAYTDPARNKA